jgi:hypothetical protein
MKKIAEIVSIVALMALGPRLRGQETQTAITAYVRGNFGDDSLVPIRYAEYIASEMLAKAKVHMNWRTGIPKTGDTQSIMVEVSTSTPTGFRQGALAFAQLSGAGHITVFYDRVRDGDSSRVTAMLLAHVLVHEIAHVLERSERHSNTGVMKAHWTLGDLMQIAYAKPLPFSAEDMQLIQQGLARRNREAIASSELHAPLPSGPYRRAMR